MRNGIGPWERIWSPKAPFQRPRGKHAEKAGKNPAAIALTGRQIELTFQADAGKIGPI